jgi:aminoglycoside phosphotransferase
MTTLLDRTRRPPAGDSARWPPELRVLLGADATRMLSVAANEAGAVLESAAPRQVTHRPPHSTVVQYRAGLLWRDGRRSTETIVAATGARIPSGAAVLEGCGTRVALWRWPVDPLLPGLTWALARDPVTALLERVGLDGGVRHLRVRAYRPGRRAVVEVTGRRGRVFLKVVRPRAVDHLHETHRALASVLPVPDSLGWTADGVLVMPALVGSTLRELLRSGGGAPPPPAAIDALLDCLPEALATGRCRRDLSTAARQHAAALTSVQPTLRPVVDRVLRELRSRPRRDHEIGAVHGDLYDAQLLVREGRFSGMLDVDTAGAGHRIEDIANLCAHLSVLAIASPFPSAIKRYGAEVLAHAEKQFDRQDLRPRIAAAIVGLATGPFRVLEPNWPDATARRVRLAQEWLDTA